MQPFWKYLTIAWACVVFAAVVGVAILITQVAFAGDAAAPAPVVIPYGNWLADALQWAERGIVVVVGGLVTAYGPPMVKLFLSDAAIKRAVDFAIANVEGATRGKVLTVDISNAVAQRALDQLVKQEPAIASWLGDAIGPRILAMLSTQVFLPTDAMQAPRMIAAKA